MVIHGDAFRMENADIELGYLLNDQVESPLRLPSGEQIDSTVLPGVRTAATVVRLGPFENGYESYAALGRWVEDNDYLLAGPAREEFLVLPATSPEEAVVEIQLPMVQAGATTPRPSAV